MGLDKIPMMKDCPADELLLIVAMTLFAAVNHSEGVTEEEILDEFTGCLPIDLAEKCRQYAIKLVMQNELAGRKN